MTNSTITQSAAPTDEQVDRALRALVPGGSHVAEWFLPHEHPKGLANVRDVVRIMFAALSATPQAPADPPKWIDDPHDMEQAQMLNPAWLKFHNLTAQEAFRQQQTPTAAATPPAQEVQASPTASDWYRVHDVLKKHGKHPGRTDDHLADVIDKALTDLAQEVQASQAVPSGRYSFVCGGGCGVCAVKLRPFECERTETIEGVHVASKYEPQIVSSCCGAEVHVYDNEADEWGAEVTIAATPAAQPVAQDVLAALQGMHRFWQKWPEFVPAPEFYAEACAAVKAMNTAVAAHTRAEPTGSGSA